MRVLEWLRELDISRCKLSRQRVRIRNEKISVPASCRLPPVVWEWIYTDVLEHDHCATPAHDTKEEIVSKSLKGDLEPKPVAIERKCSRRVLHNEEGRDAGNFWSCHVYVLQARPVGFSESLGSGEYSLGMHYLHRIAEYAQRAESGDRDELQLQPARDPWKS